MSQYPSPYSVPNAYAAAGYGYDPFEQYLAPARRAGLLLIVLGSLMTAYALCNGIGSAVMPAERFMEQSRKFGPEPSLSPETMKVTAVVGSVIVGVVGITGIGFGVGARRGSRGACIAAIILTFIIGAFVALSMLLSTLAGLVAPLFFVLTCALTIPAALLILQLVWLFQALRSMGHLRAMQMHYQAQYWQYQQQQQMYQQGAGAAAYGSAPAPPPNPEPPSPPEQQ